MSYEVTEMTTRTGTRRQGIARQGTHKGCPYHGRIFAHDRVMVGAPLVGALLHAPHYYAKEVQ